MKLSLISNYHLLSQISFNNKNELLVKLYAILKNKYKFEKNKSIYENPILLRSTLRVPGK